MKVGLCYSVSGVVVREYLGKRFFSMSTMMAVFLHTQIGCDNQHRCK